MQIDPEGLWSLCNFTKCALWYKMKFIFILLILLQVNQLLLVDSDGESYPENNLNIPENFASKLLNFFKKCDAGGPIISQFDLGTKRHWRSSWPWTWQSCLSLLVPYKAR